jgi:hypothetical protein
MYGALRKINKFLSSFPFFLSAKRGLLVGFWEKSLIFIEEQKLELAHSLFQ